MVVTCDVCFQGQRRRERARRVPVQGPHRQCAHLQRVRGRPPPISARSICRVMSSVRSRRRTYFVGRSNCRLPAARDPPDIGRGAGHSRQLGCSPAVGHDRRRTAAGARSHHAADQDRAGARCLVLAGNVEAIVERRRDQTADVAPGHCRLSRLDDRDGIARADATRKCKCHCFAERAPHSSVQSQGAEQPKVMKFEMLTLFDCPVHGGLRCRPTKS